MTRVHEPRPLFGDRWPEPPDDFEGGTVRRVAASVPVEPPSSPVAAPELDPESPAAYKADALTRAAMAAEHAFEQLRASVGWLGVVDSTAERRYRDLLDQVARYGDYVDVVRGR